MWGCAFTHCWGSPHNRSRYTISIDVLDMYRDESNSRNVNRGSFRYFWTDDAYAFWKLHVSGKDQAFLAGKVSCAKRK